MKNSISILSVLIALAIVPSISCSAVSKTKPSPVLKPRAKPTSPTVPVIAKPEAKPGTVLWEYAVKSGKEILSSPAIGTGGHIFVGSWDGDLSAVDIRTGKKKWVDDKTFGSGYYLSSPMVGPDGTVYIATHWGVAFQAFNGKTGEKKWEFPIPGERWAYTPAIGPDGTLYIGTSHNKSVHAFDSKTGKKRWSFLTKNSVTCAPVIDSKGTVYIGSQDGIFYALDGKTGEMKWKFSDEKVHSYDKSSSAIDADGIIYIPAHHSYNEKGREVGGGWLFALDSKDGAKKWEFKLPGDGETAPAIGADGTIYMCSSNGSLIALKKRSGEKKWEFKANGAIRSSPAIDDNGVVYFGSDDRNIYAVDWKTGAKKWSVRTGAGVISSPIIGDDGTLYVGARDGRLYAIATGSTGPAKSPWPMFGQNAQHTGRAPTSK